MKLSKTHPVGIKICGVTDIEDAEVIAENGGDAIGILLASPKHTPYPFSDRLSIDQASKLCRATKNITQSIMLLHETDVSPAATLINTVKPDAIQVQSCIGISSINQIKKKFSSLYIIKTIKIASTATIEDILSTVSEFMASGCIDALLFDSERPGSGVENDWEKVSLVRKAYTRFSVFVAGGINKLNVQKVIAMTSPDWVDVMSSVSDRTTHRKKKEEVVEFIKTARRVL